MFQDFLLKLKDHLIPHLKTAVEPGSTFIDSQSNPSYGEVSTSNGNQLDHDLVYFKSKRIYLHKLARIHYTTYDIRRGQDIINPSTPCRDIMLLTTTNNDVDHLFLYSHVLGIYHADVIYTGSCTPSCQARWFEFLWVQWYQHQGQNVWWSNSKLDVLSFPPSLPRVHFDL